MSSACPSREATSNLKVRAILRVVQDSIRATRSLSYQATYYDVNPGTEDSVYRTEGRVWLYRIPNDSIFGCRFRLSGKDNREPFEYFYDGQNSYEIRRDTITTFNPYMHPNTPNNPARARMALLPFVNLLIDTNIVQNLLNSVTDVSLVSKKSQRILTFKYAEDKWGAIVTRRIYMDVTRPQIREVQTDVLFRGIITKTTIKIRSIQRNHGIGEADIALPERCASYPIIKWEASKPSASLQKDTLLGLEAPDFSYADLSGDTVSLSKLRGRVVLLDFWESWCGYCLLALPKVSELQTQYRKDGLVIIGVTVDNPDQIKKLVRVNGLKYRNVLASPAVLKQYNAEARPTYVLIDRAGIIQRVSLGDLDTIKSKIAEIIK